MSDKKSNNNDNKYGMMNWETSWMDGIDPKSLNYDLFSRSFNPLSIDDFSKMWFFYDEKHPEEELINDIKNNWDDKFNKKFNYRNKDAYHIIDYLPTETIIEKYKDIKVEYKFNNNWFRSEHFKNEHEGSHILFMGCSNTEGMGTDYEKTWAKMLYNEISSVAKTSGFFNMSRSGYGWHKFINNFNVYIQKYSIPDYLFVLHPNITRSFNWIEETYTWRYNQEQPWFSFDFPNNIEDEKILNKYLASRMMWPNWITAWNLFINYANALGVKVLWGTWDSAENSNIEKFINGSNDMLKNIKNSFISIPDFNQKMQVEKYAPDMKVKYGDLEVRDGHLGLWTQLHWKDCFKNAINEKGWFNLK